MSSSNRIAEKSKYIPIPIEEITTKNSTSNENEDINSHLLKERSKIILLINRVIAFICVASFIVIIVISLSFDNKPIPEILQNSFSITLGYYGSALMSYLEVKNQK